MDVSGFGGFVFLFAFLIIWGIYLGYPLISVLIGFYFRKRLHAAGKQRWVANVYGFIIALILLLLPFADYPFQRHKIDNYCNQEGGFHITNSASDVEGVHGLSNGIDYGYLYGENYLIYDDLSTLRRYYAAPLDSKQGRFIVKKQDEPSAYGFRKERVKVDDSLFRITFQTYRTATKEELGRFVYFESDPSGEGGSINDFRQWMRMTCNGVDTGAFPQLKELLSKTLIPTRNLPKQD